jgi:hypothetical protein
VASFGFDLWYRKTKVFSGSAKAILVIIFLVHVGNFLALNIADPQGIFAPQEKAPPYEEPFENKLKSGRIVTVVYENSLDEANHKKIIPLLGFDYATLFDLYHFAGYELLVSEKNLKASMDLNYCAYFYADKDVPFNPSASELDYFRKWGVQWYLLDNKVRFEGTGALKPVYRDDNRVVLYDAAAKPFVFWTDSSSDRGTRYAFSTNSISITTERETEGQLLVNVLYNSFFRATVDGKPSDLSEAPDNRMTVMVPPGQHQVKISYRDPYFVAGMYISGGFILLIFVGWLSIRFKRGNCTPVTVRG